MGRIVAEVSTEEVRLEAGPHAATGRARSRAILRLQDDREHVGFGEAAPLPGYSPDRIDEVLRFFEECPWRTLETVDGGDPHAALDLLAKRTIEAPVSGRFALETAALDLWASRQARPVWQLLVETAPSVLPVAEVVSTLDEAAAAAGRSRGVPTLKIKVGADWSDDLAFVTEVRRRMPTARLRLDCNQRLRRDRTARLSALAAVGPEFVEEPWPLIEGGGWENVQCPLALDESLQPVGQAEAFLASLRGREHPFAALVLKPTTLGGVHRILQLTALGVSAGLQPILSHTLEGPTARAMLIQLAFACMDGRTAAGLGPSPGEPPNHGAVLQRPGDPGQG